MLNDFTLTGYLEQSNSKRQKVAWSLPGVEGKGKWGVVLMYAEFQF